MITETNPDRESQITEAINIIKTLLNDNSISAEVLVDLNTIIQYIKK
jgi:hypothetical protein